MRILHIVHGLYPDSFRGTEVYTYELCKALSRRHDIFIFTASLKESTSGFVIEDEKRENLKIRWLHRPANFLIPYRVFRSYLRQYIKEVNPDVIHFQHLYSCGHSIPKIIIKRKIPYLISIQDYYYLCPRVRLINKQGQICDGPGLRNLHSLRCGGCIGGKKTSLILLVYRTIKFYWWIYRFKKLFNNAPVILAISEYVRAKYREFGFDTKRMLINKWGVDLELFRPTVTSESQAGLNIVYLGGLIYDKGVHILIEAFKKIKGQAALKIYGEGNKEYRDFLNRVSQGYSDIYFMGKYDHRQIGQILSQAHILVIPSIWEEAYGLVVQEGLAARIPIIASDIGGIREQIFEGINGFLVKANDVSCLADKIQYVVDNYNQIRLKLRYDVSLNSICQNSEMLSQIYEALFRKELRYPITWQFRNDVDDLAEFFSKDKNIIERDFVQEWSDLGSSVRAAWHKAQPKTEKQVEDFYRLTTSYIYDLIVVHKTWSRIIWRKIAIELFHKYKVKTILDFGGGIGEDSVGFLEFGFQPTIYEIESPTAQFAKWRISKHNLKIGMITNIKDLGQYDSVYCTEVMEHLVDPVKTISLFPHLLRENGILLVTHSFQRVGKRYPSHIKENVIYAENFTKLIDDANFVHLEKRELPGNAFYLFQKR